jgi:hypothetical protein
MENSDEGPLNLIPLRPFSLMCLRLFMPPEMAGFTVEQGNQRLLTKDSRSYTGHDCLSGRRKAAFVFEGIIGRDESLGRRFDS